MTKRRACVMTIVKDEPIFLRAWLNYYTRFFDEDDIVVYDNETSDGSVEVARSTYPLVKFRSIVHTAFDPCWVRDYLKREYASILGSYSCCLFAESDEFFVPRRDAELGRYIDRFLSSTERAVRASGWEVIHQPDVEPDVDTSRPFIEQRSVRRRAYEYDKIVLSKVPIMWSKGYHAMCQYQYLTPSNELDLVHAQKIDLGLHLQRKRSRAGWKLTSTYEGNGSDNESLVRQYWTTGVCPWKERAPEGKPESIPEHWKELIRL